MQKINKIDTYIAATSGSQTYIFKTNTVTEVPVTTDVKVVLSEHCLVRCTNCRELKPLQLRTMPNGTIRNQPQCAQCRGRYPVEETNESGNISSG